MPRIEVSDRQGSWGYGGRNYRPGIWEVDEATARAAELASRRRIRVSRLPDSDAPEEVFDTSPEQDGEPLSIDDFERLPVRVVCPVDGCGKDYATDENLAKHMASSHAGWEATPVEPDIAGEPDDGKCEVCDGLGMVEDAEGPTGCDSCDGSGVRKAAEEV